MTTYPGPERRQPEETGVIVLGAIKESLDALSVTLESNLSEERLQGIVANEQRRDRVKILAAILGPVFLAILISASTLAQSRSNHRQARDSGIVAAYVRNCLQHPERLTPADRAEQCGAVDSQGFFIAYLNCVFPLQIADRDQKHLDACVHKAVAASGTTTSSTPTTR